MEFEYAGKRYLVSGYRDDNNEYVLQVDTIEASSKPVFFFKDANISKCVDAFERAKMLLSKCPHNTNIKFIRNSGETEIHRVINCGADNPDEFLDAFSYQCFSTCSNTKRSILYNKRH